MNSYKIGTLEKRRHPGDLLEKFFVERRGDQILGDNALCLRNTPSFPLEMIEVVVAQQTDTLQCREGFKHPCRIRTLVDEIPQEDQPVVAPGGDMVQQCGELATASVNIPDENRLHECGF
jgi:hypothetical protein